MSIYFTMIFNSHCVCIARIVKKVSGQLILLQSTDNISKLIVQHTACGVNSESNWM
jgi:hypothetical protein